MLGLIFFFWSLREVDSQFRYNNYTNSLFRFGLSQEEKRKKNHQQVLALPLPANFYRANSLPLPTEDILLKFLVHFGTKKKFKSGKSKNNK